MGEYRVDTELDRFEHPRWRRQRGVPMIIS